MNRTEVIDIIRDNLGFNTGLSETVILRHIDRVQTRYETADGRLPMAWFLLNTTATVDTVADQRTIDVPAGFLDLSEKWPLTIKDAEGTDHPLTREDYDLLQADLGLEGFPTHYAFDGKVVHLFPKPDAVYTINFPHYARGSALSTVTTADWYTEFPSLIIAETFLSIAKSSRDKDGIKIAMEDVTVERDLYRTAVVAKEHSLQELKLGAEVGD